MALILAWLPGWSPDTVGTWVLTVERRNASEPLPEPLRRLSASKPSGNRSRTRRRSLPFGMLAKPVAGLSGSTRRSARQSRHWLRLHSGHNKISAHEGPLMTSHWRAGARWRALERHPPAIGSSLFMDSENSDARVLYPGGSRRGESAPAARREKPRVRQQAESTKQFASPMRPQSRSSSERVTPSSNLTY
jgi:hypothetical protein